MGEIDPLGTRRQGLDAFLEQKVAEGQRIVDSVQQDVLAALPAGQREALLHALTRLVSDRLATAPQCHPPLRRREPRA